MLLRVALLAVSIALIASAPAEAVHFGGGYVPSPDTRVFDPPVNLTFDANGLQRSVPYRFSTVMRCGDRGVLEVNADGLGNLSGSSFWVRNGSERLPYPGRVTVNYEMHATINGDGATGAFHLTGKYKRGGRTASCTAGPVRALKLHAEGSALGANAAPTPNSAFYGIGGLAQPWKSPIVLAVDQTGRRAMAFWHFTADCERGPAERFADYSPRGRITGNRYLSRERFRIRYLGGVVGYYRATLDARFHGATVTGTYRMRVRFTYRARTTVRCDSKTQRFDAWAM